MCASSQLHLVLASGSWYSSAWSDRSVWFYAAIMFTGAMTLATLARALVAAPKSKATPRQLLNRLLDDSGTATVEFTLVFAPALWICLILLQTVLMFSGQLFVHYAAYAAVRSAIVHIPSGLPGGGGDMANGDAVMQSAQRAAAYALAPVSGKSNDLAGPPTAFVAGLQDYFDQMEQAAPNWVDRLAGQRLAYALAHTEAEIYIARRVDGGSYRLSRVDGDDLVYYGPKDPVTIGVKHRLHLSIPYASVFFADGKQQTAGGETAYALVRATSTLTLEGIDRQLPPTPPLEREP